MREEWKKKRSFGLYFQFIEIRVRNPQLHFIFYRFWETISSHRGINSERGGGMREDGEPKHEVASYIEGQPQGGRRKPEWHADLVPGPLDLEG